MQKLSVIIIANTAAVYEREGFMNVTFKEISESLLLSRILEDPALYLRNHALLKDKW